MPQHAGEKRHSEHSRNSESRLPGAAAAMLASEFPSQTRPDLFAVTARAFRHRHVIDECQYALDRVVLCAADVAREQMLRDRGRRFVIVIVMQYELLFCQMLHVEDLTNGSSDSRSFRTARKIVCFAAFTWMPSVLLISSTGMPSK